MRVNQFTLKCIFKRQTFLLFQPLDSFYRKLYFVSCYTYTKLYFYVFNSVLPTNVYPLTSSFHGDVAGWPLCHVARSTATGRKSPTLLRPKKSVFHQIKHELHIFEYAGILLAIMWIFCHYSWFYLLFSPTSKVHDVHFTNTSQRLKKFDFLETVKIVFVLLVSIGGLLPTQIAYLM